MTVYHMAVQIAASIQIITLHYPTGFVHFAALHLKSHKSIIWSCHTIMPDIIYTETPLFSHPLTQNFDLCAGKGKVIDLIHLHS